MCVQYDKVMQTSYQLLSILFLICCFHLLALPNIILQPLQLFPEYIDAGEEDWQLKMEKTLIILQQCVTLLGNREGGRMQVHGASYTFLVEAECLDDTSFPIAPKPLKLKLK